MVLSCWDISIKLPPGLWFNYTVLFRSQLSQDRMKEQQQGDLQISWGFWRNSSSVHQYLYIAGDKFWRSKKKNIIINPSTEAKKAPDWLEVITWLQTLPKKNPKWDLGWKLLAIHTTLKSMKICAVRGSISSRAERKPLEICLHFFDGCRLQLDWF